MSPIYAACLWLNQYLGTFAFLLLMYRITPLILDRARWRNAEAAHRGLLFALLGGYLIVTALGANRALSLDFVAGWPSLALTGLHLAAIVLCAWWPPARGRG